MSYAAAGVFANDYAPGGVGTTTVSAYVPSVNGAPNGGVGDSVLYAGPYFYETVNTRPSLP